MRTLLLLACLVLALFFGFVAFNWPVLTAPGPLSLGVSTAEGPLGLVMLGFFAAIAVTLVIPLVAQYVSIAQFTRHQAMALEAQRKLAEQAEASRFSELRTTLLTEFERLAGHLATSQDALRLEIKDNANSIAAMVSELDDRLSSRPAAP